MKSLTTLALFVFAGATLAFAAGIPANHVHGSYVEARTADVYTGPCFANSEVGLAGDLAVMGWKIDKGAWNCVTLDGLAVVGVLRASYTLGDVNHTAYPVKSVLIVDERASAEQRLALQAFAKRMGGDLLQEVVRVDYQPVELTVEDGNVHTATATLTAGTLAKIQTRAITKGDHICSNEQVWYLPLTKVGHAMPAFATANKFAGEGLGTRWNYHDQRSAFVADFQVQE